MTDFLDKEIHIGDKVVYCRSRKNGFDMIKHEVVGFTPKMVKVKKKYISSYDNKDYDVVCPKNCIIYEKVAEDDIFPPIPDMEYVTETLTDIKYR